MSAPHCGSVSAAQLREMVRQLVERHRGTRVRTIRQRASGLTNFVFEVRHAGGACVVRINPDPSKIGSFMKERWAARQARAAGVPTARILEVGNKIVPLPYMILECVRGSPATRHPAREAILHELGRYAARINRIRTYGFGGTTRRAGAGPGCKSTWQEYLQGELQLAARLRLLREQHLLPPRKLRFLRTLLEAGASRRPMLNHGDLRLKNTLVDARGKIVAIIDWENCTSNFAPQWELSLALHDLSIDEKQAFVGGYGLSTQELAAMAPLIKAFNLLNYAPVLEKLIRGKDWDGLAQCRLRLNGDFDLYSI